MFTQFKKCWGVSYAEQFFEKVGRILEQARSNAKTAVFVDGLCLL